MRESASPFSLTEVAKLHSAFEGSNQASEPQEAKPSRPVADREKLRQVAEILNGCRGNSERLPPLVRIGLAHGQIDSWRSFPSASGRMGRVLVPAMAEHLGVPGAQALGISGFLVTHSSAYRQARLGIESASEWMPWLTLFLEGVAQSASEATESIRQFADLRERHRSEIGQGFGHATVRGLRVLERLFAEPYTSIAEVRSITGTSFVAANQLAARLANLGVLEEVTGYRRNRVFRYGAFVRLFEEGPSESGAPALAASQAIARDISTDKLPVAEAPGRPSTGPQPTRPSSRPRIAPKPMRRRSAALDDFLL